MRDAIIIGIAVIAAILLGGWIFLTAPQVQTLQSGSVSYSVLAEGQQSGSVVGRTNYRIRTMQELEELWRLVYGTDGPIIPPIDFEKQEVLAVFDGSHVSGGYNIAVTSVEDVEGVSRHVTIMHTAPGESCMTSQALTSPHQIIVLSKSPLEIARTDITVTEPCN